MRDHADRLADWIGEGGGCRVPQARRLVPHRLPGRRPVPEACAMISTVAELDALLDSLDPELTYAERAAGRTRPHHRPPQGHLARGLAGHRDDPTPPEGAELLVSGG